MRALTLIIFMLCTSVSVADVVHLTNGDRITGEITEIWDDDITIEPDYSDKFKVDLSDVESIETDNAFDIELYDGRKGDFRFIGVDGEGNVLLRDNGREIVVSFSDLKRVEEIEEYFEWESKVDLSSSLTSGNTNSRTNNLNGSYQFKFGDRRTLLELNVIRETLDNDTVRNQDRFNASYNWLFRDPWFVAINGSYDQDEIAQVDGRYSINPALGYDIWDDPKRSLNVQLGAGYQSETISGVTNTGAVIDWRLRYSHEFFSGDLELYHNHQLYQNQGDGEEKEPNLVFITTTGIRYEITDDIYLNVELKYDYESEPADLAVGENITFLIGAGIEFD